MRAKPGPAGDAGLELWGGPECTVNRVGDVFRDQVRLTGHHDRIEDLARFAALGIRRLRYPVLWERVAPDSPETNDWAWSDERLAEIKRLGMTPIVGLIHHGSGPRYTNLLDPHFPRLFADHAAAVAARYPAVADWTPVNEPLTTARFSGLYGFWYPHARDDRSFWTALFNQIDATRLAMRAIRAVNPAARLIQTEDLGQTYATERLRPVADHYNARRWLTWDLLCGRVSPGHALWEAIVALGLADRARGIADDPCPPDIIGINHYVTSDRFLDDDTALGDLPESGFHDVAAARMLDPPAPGLPALIAQAWARYGRTIAITECHIGCTREEQMRWIDESWRACATARADGIDVVALTAWALVGNMDWDSLITRDDGRYETGAFDAHGGNVRATSLAPLLTRLQAGGTDMPGGAERALLGLPGWWRRPLRLDPGNRIGHDRPVRTGRQPLLITGASGTLGRAFAGACRMRGIEHVLTDRHMLAIDDRDHIAAALDRHRPWAVVNCAGWVRMDDAEGDPAGCHRANATGAIDLADACDRRGIACLSFSSDQVFDGLATRAYTERDIPHPGNVYGDSKLAAERGCAPFERSIMVRTAAFFSPYDQHNFVMHAERALRAGMPFPASGDHVVTPTYVPDLVNACLDLVIDDASGLWHLTNHTTLSWAALARLVARHLDLDDRLVIDATAEQLGWTARRPLRVPLASSRGRMLPPLDDALERHMIVRRLALQADRFASIAA